MDKKALKAHCMQLLHTKVGELKRTLADFQDSANSETKSTAGDKFDTSRSMMQLEVDKIYNQIKISNDELVKLSNIPTDTCLSVRMGAIVQTDKNVLYLSIGLGQVMYKEERLFCLSANAPIAQKIMGLKVGDSYEMNGNIFVIKEIY